MASAPIARAPIAKAPTANAPTVSAPTFSIGTFGGVKSFDVDLINLRFTGFVLCKSVIRFSEMAAILLERAHVQAQ